MLGIEPKMTGQQLQDIEANRLNTQKLAFETGGDDRAYHAAFTGFDPVTGQSISDMPAAPGSGFAEVQAEADSRGFQGSVFDEGGAFGGKQ